jgi:hypothetical protein
MSQFYTDPSRENDPHSLPNAEAFFAEAGEWAYDGQGERTELEEGNEDQEVNAEGWYWWPCFPGRPGRSRLRRRRSPMRDRATSPAGMTSRATLG